MTRAQDEGPEKGNADGCGGLHPEGEKCPLCVEGADIPSGQEATITDKIENYRLYVKWGARGANGTTFKGPHYNPADLCEVQARAIGQLQEYLDPNADAYLVALVEDAAKRERERDPAHVEALAHVPQDAVIRRLEAVEADPVAYRTLEEYRALALDALHLLRGPAQPVPRDKVIRKLRDALREIGQIPLTGTPHKAIATYHIRDAISLLQGAAGTPTGEKDKP